MRFDLTTDQIWTILTVLLVVTFAVIFGLIILFSVKTIKRNTIKYTSDVKRVEATVAGNRVKTLKRFNRPAAEPEAKPEETAEGETGGESGGETPEAKPAEEKKEEPVPAEPEIIKTTYYITFEIEDTKKYKEFSVSRQEYERLKTGDKGTLITRGIRYLGFDTHEEPADGKK